MTILRAVLFLLPVLFLNQQPTHAESGNFITLSELKPEMRGKALSVLKGIEPESFAVEFQGLIEGPVAGNRYMLLRVIDESLRVGSGFSGSPVYFDGRLAGAISHMDKNMTTQFVMAVPIERMLEEASFTVRKPENTGFSGKLPEPGSMISIPYVRGDFNLGAAGTVTYVNDGMLLAFGHENLFSGNSLELPIHRAAVIAVIPKIDMPHKEVSTLEEIGSVKWDGKSAIVGHLGGKALMSPLLIEFGGATGKQRSYNLEMVSFTKIAPSIITRVVRHLITSLVPNRNGGTDIEITISATLKGLDNPVVINQRLNSDILKSESSSGSNQLESLLNALLLPISDTKAISSFAIKMKVLPDSKVGKIKEAVFARTRARSGETVNLLVRLNGPYGELKEISIPVTVPAGYEDPVFTVSIHPGTSIRPSETPPASEHEIGEWLSGIARSDDLVILYPATMTSRYYPASRITRTLARSPWNVEGSGEASIKVIKHD